MTQRARTAAEQDLVRHALAAVEDACVVCRHVQSRLETLRHMTKDDASPVTIGDFAAQAVVVRGLSRAGMMLGGMVAEESAEFLKQAAHRVHLNACVAALRESGAWPDATEDEVVGNVDLGSAKPECLNTEQGGWTLDPIDGTKGFLRGEQYCVCLALIRRGVVEVGMLGCPNLGSGFGSRYWAVRGGRSHVKYVNDDAPAQFELEIRPTKTDGPARLAESVEPSHTRKELVGQIMKLAGPVGPPVVIDSQCKYALLARNDADVYLRLPSKRGYVQKIWDHAPGVLIAQEAGCIVTDVLGKELDFSRGTGLEANLGILGAPPGLHERLVSAAKQVLSEAGMDLGERGAPAA